jgi:transposase
MICSLHSRQAKERSVLSTVEGFFMGKIRKTYTPEEKFEVVDHYLNNGWTKRTILAHYRISSSMLQRWVTHYKREGLLGLEEKRGKSFGIGKGRPRKNPLSLEQENERLRAENEFLKKLWALRKGEK